MSGLSREQLDARVAALEAEIDGQVEIRGAAQVRIDRLLKQLKLLQEAQRSLDFAQEQIEKAERNRRASR